MKDLPPSEKLNIDLLSRMFANTSASYKFLLFRSILDAVGEGESKLDFRDLALRSIARAWYSIHFYKLSYGSSDRMTRWVASLDEDFKNRVLISDLTYHHILAVLRDLPRGEFIELEKFISEFSLLVPYRLISPWFEQELRGLKDAAKNRVILRGSKKSNFSLYEINEEGSELKLKISEKWASYLQTHYTILQGWWSFHFLEYLQKRNPTVLSLATKLSPPEERNMNLISRVFNDYYSLENMKPRCFYSGQIIQNTLSKDHFLPWSFLGSDPLYNFVPTTKSLNSSKSNQVPHKKLLNDLCVFQFKIFSFLKKENKNKALEFYYNDLHLEGNPSVDEFSKCLKEFYSPLFLTAKNQGFSMGWLPNR